MQRENPVLVKKLIDYQLKAKDVLAAAFLGDKKTTEYIIPVYKPQGNMIQLQFPDIQMPTIPDYSNRLDEINNKIDKLYAEMGKFATAMINTNANPVKLNNTTPVKKEGGKKVLSSAEQEYYNWKRRTNEFVDKLSESSKFTDRNSVLKYLYDYINKTYGIVWDQEKRESTEEDIPIFLKFLHLMLFMKMNNCVQFSIVLWQIWLKSIKIHAK